MTKSLIAGVTATEIGKRQFGEDQAAERERHIPRAGILWGNHCLEAKVGREEMIYRVEEQSARSKNGLPVF
ncbi:MAG: hypothetical protein WAO00_20025 [Chthoniobacterales bacterium]